MASKRKRDVEEGSVSPNAKQIKMEEVTRSGRVRKKPAKFVDDVGEENDMKPDVDKVIHSPSADVPLVPSPQLSPQVIKVGVLASPAVLKHEPETDIKEEILEEDIGKTPSRSGRARKKSAKVLEMEEFEEAEKKQTVKKDAGKKTKPLVAQNVTVLQTATSPVAAMSSIPVLKIKDIPTLPKVESLSPPSAQVQISPQKSPVIVSSKSPDNKGSVIKLLLSSPAQSANTAVSTPSMSQAQASPEPASASVGKKGKAKGKAAGGQQSSPEQKSKIRQVLQSPPVNTVQIQPGVLQGKVKSPDASGQPNDIHVNDTVETLTENVKETKSKKGGKKSVSAVVKDESPFLPPPMPSPSVIHVGPMNIGLEVKQETETSVGKKGKKGKSKVGQAKLEVGEPMMNDDFGLDMSEIELGDTGEDSFMEIDDDDSLVIPEEEVEMEKPKSGKGGKKKGGKAKVQLGDIPNISSTLGDPNTDDGVLVMDFARMKSDDKKKKKEKGKNEETLQLASKKKRAPTAYMMWCSANRPKLVYENPGIDFSTISKTLGEMWSNLSEKEKVVWKRRAKKAAGKGSTLITTGKAQGSKAVPQATTARQAAALSQKTNPALAQALLATKQPKPSMEDLTTPIKGFGMEPVDVAAHLKIVGESLSIIGMKLQEHRGLIAVQGSLSVLLDSMLCALAPLMCLTAVLPETNGLPAETHLKNLDNIAYIMPGL